MFSFSDLTYDLQYIFPSNFSSEDNQHVERIGVHESGKADDPFNLA
jgi:hypothetical protein